MFYYSQKWIAAVSERKSCSVLRRMSAVIIITAPMSACGASLSSDALIAPAGAEAKSKLLAVERQRISTAEKYFHEGKYGSAEQAYRMAIETNPRNVEAWLGIAATYDQLKKFPNANRAYMISVKLKGYTPEILNNLGYHYILRGELKKARKALTAAIKKQPDNQFIQNNMRLLEQYETKGQQTMAKGK